MMQARSLPSPELSPSAVGRSAAFLTARELLLAVVGGVASMAIGQILGRSVHLAWPVPISGSVAVALPRAIILLLILRRINRFGALTTAGVAEVGAKLAIGLGGLSPLCLIVPLVGNVAADTLWFWLRRLPIGRMRLMLTGGCLCGARVLAALFFWSLLGLPISGAPKHLTSILVCIIAINISLGVIAGFLVGWRTRRAHATENR